MKIDRERVLQQFKEYTSHYNGADEKTALKIGHTYRVAGLCRQIACSEKMDEEEQSLAWLLGMLHDIGRFEQLRRYDTFNDADSVDHALLGVQLLYGVQGAPAARENAEVPGAVDGQGVLAARREAGPAETVCSRRDTSGQARKSTEGMIGQYIEDTSEDALIETAIRVHNAYRVPEGLDSRTEKFCHILRDADKIDILRVNIETPLEEIYNTTKEELYHAEITESVMDSFYEHHATLRSLKRTSVDHIAGHVSLIYELVFPESVRLVREQGYWEKLLDFPSRNPRTLQQLGALKKEMRQYLEKKAAVQTGQLI